MPELMLPDNMIHFIQFPGMSMGSDMDVSCAVWPSLMMLFNC